MQPPQDLLQRGIAAFQAGDKESARALLTEHVEAMPDSEQGWYYLAAVETDPIIRKRHLERVLALNPGNAKARAVLDRIREREGGPPVVAAEPAAAGESMSAPEPAPMLREVPRPPGRSKIRALSPDDDRESGAAAPGEGIRLPFRIPGAPERISPAETVAATRALLLSGWQVLLRRPGVYSYEINGATWWRYFLVVTGGLAVAAGLGLLLALLITIQTGSTLFAFVSILLTPLLTFPIVHGALFAGIYASYRYAQSKGWHTPLVRHAMVAGIVMGPTLAFNAVITFILALAGVGGYGGLLMLILCGAFMAEGFATVYNVTEPRDKYALPAITLLVMLVAIVIIQIVLGGLIIGQAIPFALF